jgi:formylglycine-generating enzyme required for sulfatase activity
MLLQVLAAHVPPSARGPSDPLPVATVTVDDLPGRRGRWRPVAALLLLTLLLLSLLWTLTRSGRPAETITVPGGLYSVTTGNGDRVPVELAPFVIDRTEVTNRAWTACVQRGGCVAPPDESATRTGYFSRRSFAGHPVLFVSHPQAAAYCALQGKRLPTAAEWEVAATFAPATNRLWRYPWGEVFQPAFVVGGDLHDDTAAVGSRSPQGDSPLGVADMAGNVAEWTATPQNAAPDEPRASPNSLPPLLNGADPAAYIVKGGSFRDGAGGLLPAATPAETAATQAPWLGFRCASTPLP